MDTRPLGRSGLQVSRICLGGNVFGWTADEAHSHAVLDAYAAAGGNFIDTANSYLVEHGRSETIIGGWLETVETTVTRTPRRCIDSTSGRKSPRSPFEKNPELMRSIASRSSGFDS